MAPAVSIYQGIHGGSMPTSGSFLAIDAPNVDITAIKQSENGDDLIIRCVETYGQPTSASVDLRFANRKWTGNFRAFEIKTLLFNQKSGIIKEVSLLEE
jgi:alpha-mannosidase